MGKLDGFVTDNGNRNMFIIQLTFTCLAAGFNFTAFISPCWIEAKSGAYALFNRIGLWTVCFDGYMRPNQYNKAYYGCFYIYHVEYDAIRNWINPVWLYIVQVVASVGLICHALAVFVLLCQLAGRMRIESLEITKWLMGGHFVSGVSSIVTIVGFTYGSMDSRWMPYPRFNTLSWSFGVAVVSLLVTICAFFTLLVFYLKVNMKLSEENSMLQLEADNDIDDDDDDNYEAQKLAKRVYADPDSFQTSSRMVNYPARHGAGIQEYLGDNNDNDDDIVYPYPVNPLL